MLFAAVTAFVPVLAPGDAVPAVPLVDQLGRPFDFSALRGRTVVVGFGYTRCRDGDACPMVGAKLAKVQALVRHDPITIVEMTVDPARDDPATLHAYGAMFGADPARWRFATGQPAAVTELVERFGVEISPSQPNGQIPHSEAAIVVDAQGRVADRLAGDDWTPADLVARARSVAGRPTSAFDQLRIALTRGIEAACGGGKSGVTLGAGMLIFFALVGGFGYVLLRAFRLGPPKIDAQSTIQAASVARITPGE
jgi:protein SCO1/2